MNGDLEEEIYVDIPLRKTYDEDDYLSLQKKIIWINKKLYIVEPFEEMWLYWWSSWPLSVD